MFEKLKKFLGLNKTSKTKPQQQAASFKCENCGAPTYRISEGLVKCGHCGNIQNIPKSISEPQVLDKGKQEEEPKRIEKGLFPEFEYSDLVNEDELPFANKDPLMEFAEDSAIIQKKLNKEFLEDDSRE